ncbi:MAG: DUF885 domain-containing protein, partial [Actinomycetota bacterium]|nr:DUF885 domain-containing protein [Actinomycetota bacterium]
MNSPRTPTAVDAVADTYLDETAALDPILATYFGIAGYDDKLPAFDPDWLESVSGLRRRTLQALDSVEAVDSSDRVTAAALRSELGLAEQLRDAGADAAHLNNIASPLQEARDTFDLMPTATADDWATVARRLSAIPASLQGYAESLRSAAALGVVPARRQVEIGASQCADNVGPDGFFTPYAKGAAIPDGTLPDAVRADLERGAAAANEAYLALSTFLR